MSNGFKISKYLTDTLHMRALSRIFFPILLTIAEIVAVIGAILAFYPKNIIWSLNVSSKHDLLYQF